jgi:hypothetical protein
VGERSERCSPVTCDDDDPCTDDVLQENQCESARIAGTCWRGDEATLRIIATGSAYGRTAQCRLGCRAPFSGVLVLRDDGTYVSPGMTVPGCVGGATVTVPDEVGVVRRARRGKLVLEPTNRGELEAAFEQCAGPGTRLKGYRTVVHPSPDGQALTGTSTARIRTRQGRIPVAITLRIRFTTSRVEHPAASRAAVAARRPLPVCSPSLRPVCSVR